MNMRNLLIPISFIGLMSSCIVGKDARILKKTTKEWRESPVVLHGYLDTPMAGVFLTLRENGKFEYETSGMLASFSAGTWIRSGDTLHLNYLDSKQNITETSDFIMERETSKLKLVGDSSTIQMRYTILSDKWK